jgi:hypothetical protein
MTGLMVCSILLLFVLLTIVVVRLSEISTRLHKLERCVVNVVSHDDCAQILDARLQDYVTSDALRTLVTISTPMNFTVGT